MGNTIICDSDFAQDVRIENANREAQNISGWTFEAKCIRECKTIHLIMGSGIEIQDAEGGVIRISLTASQTKSFGPGESRWILWRTDNGRRVVIGEGSAPFEGLEFDA